MHKNLLYSLLLQTCLRTCGNGNLATNRSRYEVRRIHTRMVYYNETNPHTPIPCRMESEGDGTLYSTPADLTYQVKCTSNITWLINCPSPRSALVGAAVTLLARARDMYSPGEAQYIITKYTIEKGCSSNLRTISGCIEAINSTSSHNAGTAAYPQCGLVCKQNLFVVCLGIMTCFDLDLVKRFLRESCVSECYCNLIQLTPDILTLLQISGYSTINRARTTDITWYIEQMAAGGGCIIYAVNPICLTPMTRSRTQMSSLV